MKKLLVLSVLALGLLALPVKACGYVGAISSYRATFVAPVNLVTVQTVTAPVVTAPVKVEAQTTCNTQNVLAVTGGNYGYGAVSAVAFPVVHRVHAFRSLRVVTPTVVEVRQAPVKVEFRRGLFGRQRVIVK